MNTARKAVVVVVLLIMIMALLGLVTASGAFGKIREECSNNGGSQPPGQQGKCNGRGLTCVAVNPQDHPPPGHNPC